MARIEIMAHPLIGSYPSLPVSPAAADMIFTASDDPTSRFTSLFHKKTTVLAYNTDSGAHTITFSSVADLQRRVGDISAYSVAAGKIAAFGPFEIEGWSNSGQLWIDVSDPKLRLAVISLP